MTWDELVEKAEKLGYEYFYEISEEDGECEYLCDDSRYHNYQFYKEGDIFLDNFDCSGRTPDQMYKIMLALED
jgi:hypothetical protein